MKSWKSHLRSRRIFYKKNAKTVNHLHKKDKHIYIFSTNFVREPLIRNWRNYWICWLTFDPKNPRSLRNEKTQHLISPRFKTTLNGRSFFHRTQSLVNDFIDYENFDILNLLQTRKLFLNAFQNNWFPNNQICYQVTMYWAFKCHFSICRSCKLYLRYLILFF